LNKILKLIIPIILKIVYHKVNRPFQTAGSPEPEPIYANPKSFEIEVKKYGQMNPKYPIQYILCEVL